MEEEALWNPEEHNLTVILTSLQNLLDNPDLERIANPQAAELLEYAPQSYFKMIKECVTTSQRLLGSYHRIKTYYFLIYILFHRFERRSWY